VRVPQAELPADLPIHNNLVRAIYLNPDLHRSFGSLAMRVHSASHLSDRLRELAVLRTIAVLRADYEWGNHVVAARRVGITDVELRNVRAGDLEDFTADEALVMRLAEAIDRREVDDTLWSEASTVLSAVELLDLVMVVGFYGFASRLVLALDVPLDDGVHGLEEP
jgi:alkylhydroperoxidase family enzyme